MRAKSAGGWTDAKKCMECGVHDTPQWRQGPAGPQTLCNACGVRYSRMSRKCGKRPAPEGDLPASPRPVAASLRGPRACARHHQLPVSPPSLAAHHHQDQYRHQQHDPASDSYTDSSSREDRLTPAASHPGGGRGSSEDMSLRDGFRTAAARGSSEESGPSEDCPPHPLPLFKATTPRAGGGGAGAAPGSSPLAAAAAVFAPFPRKGLAGAAAAAPPLSPRLRARRAADSAPAAAPTDAPDAEAALSLLRMAALSAAAAGGAMHHRAPLKHEPSAPHDAHAVLGARATPLTAMHGLPPLAAAAVASAPGCSPTLPDLPGRTGLAVGSDAVAEGDGADAGDITDIGGVCVGPGGIDALLLPLLPLLSPEQAGTLHALCQRYEVMRREVVAAQSAADAVQAVLQCKQEEARQAGDALSLMTRPLERAAAVDRILPGLPALKLGGGGAGGGGGATASDRGPGSSSNFGGGLMAPLGSLFGLPSGMATPPAAFGLGGGESPASAAATWGRSAPPLLFGARTPPGGATAYAGVGASPLLGSPPRCHSAKKSSTPKRSSFQ
ncbi:hypothetical protein FOA52_010619 [Chlamydomonas sp. UWO 241]|nr:hypothetical protein FOA52_010619 [Chlamydomonas sp. UWO 241]